MNEKEKVFNSSLPASASSDGITEFLDTDELTGIYDKRAFFRRVRRILDDNPDKAYLIARWDIDRFKVFNDAFGMDAGDRLLSDIGAMLRNMFKRDVLYSHIEADHFALCIPENEVSVNDILNDITAWFAAYPVRFNFFIRMGIYRIEAPDLEVSLMCDRAMLALRSVKQNYSQQIAYYDTRLRDALIEEQELLDEFHEAIEEKQFILFYQPQYNYDNGKIIGAEALVRWYHPKRGLLPPVAFIPLLENNGLITELDAYVREAACIQLRYWLDHPDKYEVVPVSVNLSRHGIIDSSICESFRQITEKYGIPSELLKPEITESAYTDDPERIIDIVKSLQNSGFAVAMDDFGSGYSSLNTLKDIPVSLLKLDMKFLSNSSDSSRGGNILSSIIRMMRWLKLPVIAEGVESKMQADYLKSLGCTLMQGYHFARPMPAEDYEKLLGSGCTGKVDTSVSTDIDNARAFWDASSQTTLIFNSLAGGAAIIEYQKGGNVEALRINDNFFKSINTTRDRYAALQTHILDGLTEESRKVFTAALDRAAETHEETECEAQNKSFDDENELFWVRTRIRLLAQDQNSSIFYTAIENIEDRKKLAAENEHQRAFLESLYNTVPCGIMQYKLVNGKRELTSYNDTSWKLFGYESDEEYRKATEGKIKVIDSFPEDMPMILNNIERVVKGEKCDFEHRIVRRDGIVAWVRTILTKAVSIDGAETIQCVFFDITEQKKSEMDRYSRVLYSFYDEVFEFDIERQKVILRAGKKEIESHIGTEDDIAEYVNKWSSLVVPADKNRVRSFLTDTENDTETRTINYKYKNNDTNEIRWVSSMMFYVNESKRLVCNKDITAEMDAQRIADENKSLVIASRERKAEDERNRIFVESVGMSIFDYEVATDTMRTGIRSASGKSVSRTIRNYLKKSKPSRYIHPDDLVQYRSAFNDALCEPTTGSLDARIKFSDGDYRWNRVRYTSVADETGRVSILVGFFDDIQTIKNEEEELRDRTEEYRIIIEQSGKQAFRYNVASDTVYALGQKIADAIGRPHTPQDAVKTGNIAPESISAYIGFYDRMRRGEPKGSCDIKIRTEKGLFGWFHADYTMLYDKNGKPSHSIISVFDNTFQREKDIAYAKWQETLDALKKESVVYMEINLSANIVEKHTGLDGRGVSENEKDSVAKFIAFASERIASPEDKAPFFEFFDRERLLKLYFGGIHEDNFEYKSVSESGKVHWLRANVQMVRYPHSDDIMAFIVFTDIDNRRNEIERLSELASRDSLTNLYNRNAIEKNIGTLLSKAADTDMYALFMIDIDNFKQVNDRLGHQQGDRTLTLISSAISDVFKRTSSITGRFGGDEFMVFMPKNADMQTVEKLSNRLINSLLFTVGGNVSLSASVGIVTGSGTNTFEKLYRLADSALYSAKNAGKNRYMITTDEATTVEEKPSPKKASGSIQLQALLQHMDGGVVLLEIAENVRQIYVSPSFCTMMGCAYESYALPRLLRDVKVHPDDIGAYEKALRDGEKNGTVVDCVFRNSTDGVNWFWRHCRAVKIEYESDFPVMIAVITDITEMKRSSEMFEAIVKYSPIGIGIYEVGKKIRAIFYNDYLAEHTGLKKKDYNELVKQDASILLYPDDLANIRRALAEGLADGQPHEVIYRTNARILGIERAMKARGVKIGEQNGNPLILVMFTETSKDIR